MGTALALGGTVTGEHGVGTLKARHLAQQLGPDVLDLMRSVKAALDPARDPQPRQVALTSELQS